MLSWDRFWPCISGVVSPLSNWASFPQICLRARLFVVFYCSCDVIRDVIVCKTYVFADSQGSRLNFPVVENVVTQMHIQLAARREFMIKILECIFTLKILRRLESGSARNNIHQNNKQKPEIMGVGRIYSRVGPLGNFSKFFPEGPKVAKFVFSHPKLRKQPFLLKISKYRGPRPPCSALPTPIPEITNENIG